MEPTVKIQQGNDFLLKLRPRMIDGTLVSPALITDLVVNVGGTVLEHNIDGEFVTVQVPAGQPLGKYDVTITGKIGDRKIRDCRKELFERVPDGEGIPYAEYVTDFYIIGSTDEELERMKHETEQAKRDYLQAKATADAARAEYIRKAELLNDIVTNAKLDENTVAIMRAVEEGGIKPEQFEQIAKADELAKVKQALNIADPAELTPMTNEEILDEYEVIAENTYGHSQPVEVTIDSAHLTLYQERSYHHYGYTTLYDAQGQQIDINKHPEEGEHLFTVQPEPDPDPVNVTIDGVAAEMDSTKTYAENGYSAIYKNNDASDAKTSYPQEGDVLVTDPNVVDLGLSVLWCRTNLGATSNIEAGKYYSWANTDGHLTHRSGNFDAFDDAYFNQSYYNNTPGDLFTGATLDAEHDAAMVESDGAYCIPSEAQMSELIALDKTVIMDGDLPIAIKFSGNGGELVIPFGKHGKDDYVIPDTQAPRSAEVWVNGSNKSLYAASASNVYIGVSNKFYGLNIRPVKPISNE